MSDKPNRILYVGNDLGHWKEIVAKIKSYYPNETFEFVNRYGSGKEIYGDLFLDICHNRPLIIYIDFSVDPLDCLYLAKLIRRENSLKHIPIVGLVDYLSTDEHILETVFTGIPFTHIKSGEYFSKAYCPMYLASPEKSENIEFATAKVDEDFNFKEIFRVGYVGEDYIHFEGNTHFQKDDIIRLEQNVFDQNILPSFYYKIDKVFNENLYYDYQTAYEASFQFKYGGAENPDNKLKGDEKAKFGKIPSDIASRIKKWVVSHAEKEHSKSTKILVIDLALKIYAQAPDRLEKYPFSFRSQTFLIDEEKELRTNRPHIICFRLEEDIDASEEVDSKEQQMVDMNKKAEEEVSQQNNFDCLKKLVETTSKIENYNPFFVVFAEKRRTSEVVQQALNYKKIMCLSKEIDIELILKLATKLQNHFFEKENKEMAEKLEALKKENLNKYAKFSAKDLIENKVFFSKSDKRSWAFYEHKTTLLEINEIELYARSDRMIPLFTPMLVETPIRFFVTFVPMQDSCKWQKESGVYRGLIHVLAEDEQMELRQWINSYFFK